jgi:6-phosphogluconolactonase (cycloisomerase 2 family)
MAALAALACLPSVAQAAPILCCGAWTQPHQIVFSADGRFAYSSGENATLALARDTDTGSLSAIEANDFGGSAMALSPDGSSLYVASGFSRYRIATFARDQGTGLLKHTGNWTAAGGGAYSDLAVSRDGHEVYASDPDRDAVVILARDPTSGALSYRGEVRSGDPDVEDLHSPRALELTGDDRLLYVGTPDGVLAFARATDGSLTFDGGSPICGCGYRDLALAPDGRHVFGPLSALDRDPDTGELEAAATFADATRASTGGFHPGTDNGTFAIAPDGKGMWVIDEGGDRVIQLAYGSPGFGQPEAFTTVRSYREGVDASGLRAPRSVALSPDGRHVYVPSADQSYRLGRIAVFERDPSTNGLRFVSSFEGPPNDGAPPGERPSLAVTINGGDEYTNDPDVDFAIAGLNEESGQFGFQVSNDGGFGEGTVGFNVIDQGERYPWTLATSGPERLAKTVYVRVLGPDGEGGVVSDDIVLDQRPPAVDAASVVSVSRAGKRVRRVRIRAHDRLSGLGRMQVTRRRSRPGKWKRYSSTAALPKGHGQVFVRVRDRAGNRSRWRRAGVRRHR